MSTASPPKPLGRFVTMFRKDGRVQLPSGFNVEEIPGLESVEFVRSATDTLIAAEWRGKEFYEDAGGAEFRSALGLAPEELIQDGYTAAGRRRSEPWYKRGKNLYLWIVGLLAVFGNFEALRELHWKLFNSPVLTVEPKPRRIRMAAGDEAKVEMVLHNVSRSSVSAAVQGVSLSADGPISLEPAQQSPEVDRGKSTSLNLTVFAVRPGKTLLKLKGSASSGMLRETQPLPLLPEVEVDVWPDLDATPEIKVGQQTGTAAVLHLIFRHGRPGPRVGYSAVLSVPGAAEADFRIAGIADNASTIIDAGDTDKVDWAAEAMTLKPQLFELSMQSVKSLSAKEWEDLTKHFKVFLERVPVPTK